MTVDACVVLTVTWLCRGTHPSIAIAVPPGGSCSHQPSLPVSQGRPWKKRWVQGHAAWPGIQTSWLGRLDVCSVPSYANEDARVCPGPSAEQAPKTSSHCFLPFSDVTRRGNTGVGGPPPPRCLLFGKGPHLPRPAPHDQPEDRRSNLPAGLSPGVPRLLTCCCGPQKTRWSPNPGACELIWV